MTHIIEMKCKYQQLDNGIHELTIIEPSRDAVDEMVNHIDDIMGNSQRGDHGERYLIDNSLSDAPPLSYTTTQIKGINARRPADLPPGCIAILYDGMLVTLANSMLRLAMKNQLCFFQSSQRKQAISWLLAMN